MKGYNGHRSRAYWNVSLWLLNDEGLYNLCRDTIRRCSSLDEAAHIIYKDLLDCGIMTTPDGYAYSIDKIRRAISRDL